MTVHMSKMITYTPRKKNIPFAVFTAPNREVAEHMVSNKTRASWGCRSFRASRGEVNLVCRYDNDYVYLTHFQKFRKKVYRHGDTFPKIFNDEMVLTDASTIVEHAHWKVTIYKFLIDRVISARQHTRRFDVVLTN